MIFMMCSYQYVRRFSPVCQEVFLLGAGSFQLGSFRIFFSPGCIGRSTMTGMVTTETAYAILGVPQGSDFTTTAKAFRDLRDKYDPAVNPYRRKEFAEVMAAFEFLQRQF